MAGAPMRESSATMTAAAASTPSPSTVSRIAHARSGALRRAETSPGLRSGSLAGAITSLAGSEDWLSIDGHPFQRLLDLLDHRLRQRRVIERRRLLLAVVHGPPDEIQQRTTFRGVLLIPVDEQIRECSDGICAVAGLIGDRDAVIFRYRRLRRRRRDGLQRRLDPLTVVASQLRRRQLVLVCVCQLDVPDRPLGLLHQAGAAVAALSAPPCRPVDARPRA